eukprot:4741221-Lingulodinium_polyedra.AAC.1
MASGASPAALAHILRASHDSHRVPVHPAALEPQRPLPGTATSATTSCSRTDRMPEPPALPC